MNLPRGTRDVGNEGELEVRESGYGDERGISSNALEFVWFVEVGWATKSRWGSARLTSEAISDTGQGMTDESTLASMVEVGVWKGKKKKKFLHGIQHPLRQTHNYYQDLDACIFQCQNDNQENTLSNPKCKLMSMIG